jgi:hypothetical protein
MSILDKFVSPTAFVPSSVGEYFALQLAQKLDAVDDLHFYLQICERFGQDHVLNVYRQLAVTSGPGASELFRSHFIN